MKSPGGGKALLFEKPTINGEGLADSRLRSTRWARTGGWRWRWGLGRSTNLPTRCSSSSRRNRPRHARGMDAAAAGHRPAPRAAEPGSDGPCKEVIHRFDGAACAGISRSTNLPVLKCWPKDGGRFITLPERAHARPRHRRAQCRACTACRFTTDAPRACTGRCTKSARATANVTTNAASACRWRSRLGRRSGDDLRRDGAVARWPGRNSLAGFIRKKSVELVKCETNDLEVPADADFVLEGYVEPGELLRAKGRLAITPGFTRRSTITRSFI